MAHIHLKPLQPLGLKDIMGDLSAEIVLQHNSLSIVGAAGHLEWWQGPREGRDGKAIRKRMRVVPDLTR